MDQHVARVVKLWFEAPSVSQGFCVSGYDPDQAHWGDVIVKNKAYAVLAALAFCFLLRAPLLISLSTGRRTFRRLLRASWKNHVFEHYTLCSSFPSHFSFSCCCHRGRQIPRECQSCSSRTSHNTLIEVIWTVGPVIVLLFLAIPSFQLLTRRSSRLRKIRTHGSRRPATSGTGPMNMKSAKARSPSIACS